MRVDFDSIQAKFELFKGYVGELEGLLKEKEEFFHSLVLRMAVERLLQLSIECLLDIAQHIAAAKGKRPPESYSDCIKVLEEVGLIKEEKGELYRSIIRFRNILVHGYARIDPKIVYERWTKGLSDLRDMARDLLMAAEDP